MPLRVTQIGSKTASRLCAIISALLNSSFQFLGMSSCAHPVFLSKENSSNLIRESYLEFKSRPNGSWFRPWRMCKMMTEWVEHDKVTLGGSNVFFQNSFPLQFFFVATTFPFNEQAVDGSMFCGCPSNCGRRRALIYVRGAGFRRRNINDQRHYRSAANMQRMNVIAPQFFIVEH